jgi:hypothetical protein
MGTSEFDPPGSWVTQACTLPTAERPVRVAEFDRLFTDAVRTTDRQSATRLALELEPTPEVAAQTARLVARETACCSFFTFTLVATGGALRLEVSVPDAHVDVMDALAARASGSAGVRA